MLEGIDSAIIIILSAILLWLTGLSVVFYRLLRHYKRIGSKVSEGDLIDLVNKLIDSNEKTLKKLGSAESEIRNVKKELRLPVQKLAIKKYNPFSEVGGDQSFSLCVLNLEDNGLILTSLHTRDRTRVYLKPINSGQSKYELSQEEQETLKKALKQKK